jgi:hypothetical protein
VRTKQLPKGKKQYRLGTATDPITANDYTKIESIFAVMSRAYRIPVDTEHWIRHANEKNVSNRTETEKLERRASLPEEVLAKLGHYVKRESTLTVRKWVYKTTVAKKQWI